MAKATQYQQEFAAKMQKEEDEQIENLPTIRMIGEEPDAFESVGSMLDELREGGEYAELSVYGRPKQQPGQPAQRGNAFLMVCGAGDYTLAELMSLIQESWGEGLYTLKGKRGGKYAGQKTIPIGPAASKPGQATPVAVTLPVDTNKQMAELFDKMLRQQTETMAAMLGSVLTKLDRPAIDPMALQRDTIGMLASMREVFAPPAQQVSAAASPTSTFSQLKELLEIKNLLAGEGGGGDEGNPLMDMAKTFLPALMAGAQNTPALQAPQPKPQALMRPPATNTAIKSPTNQPPTESPAMIKMLQGLKTLTDAAKRDADVDLYAELIVDQFDIDQIKSFIADHDALDKLALFSNDVKIHRVWFEKLRTTILNWIAEAEADIQTDDSKQETSGTKTPDDGSVNGDTSGG